MSCRSCSYISFLLLFVGFISKLTYITGLPTHMNHQKPLFLDLPPNLSSSSENLTMSGIETEVNQNIPASVPADFDPEDLRPSHRQSRSSGYRYSNNNGAQTALLMQLLASQNNAKNCNATGNGNSDFNQMLPLLLASMQNNVPAGGYS